MFALLAEMKRDLNVKCCLRVLDPVSPSIGFGAVQQCWTFLPVQKVAVNIKGNEGIVKSVNYK